MIGLTALWGLALPMLCANEAQAQRYKIDWHTVDVGGVQSGSSASYQLSGTTGQPDAFALHGTGQYRVAGGFWGFLATPPRAPLSDPTGIDKTRYISLSVPSASGQTAFQVKLVSLMHPDPPNLPQYPPPDFSAAEGTVRYAGVPWDLTETEVPTTTFKCSPLQCDPVYIDWNSALAGKTLHITGQGIVPSSTYEVRQLAASCQGHESTCLAISDPLIIRTQRWGDVAAAYQGPSPAPLTQPNITDIAACVDKFKGVPTAIIVARTDVNPAMPNGRVDIADVASIVDGFKNLAYAFPGPGATCPPGP